MQNVPKIVQARLRRQAPAAADQHPDADLLTAFAEHSLGARERDHVLEHLARCEDCREVVALALPPTEGVALANSDSRARIGWLNWPMLRWGVVAGGILAVTSVGILQYRQRHQEKTLVATSLMSRGESNESSARSPAPTSHATASQPVVPQTEAPQTEAKNEPSRIHSALAVEKPAPAPNIIVARPEPIHRATSAGTFHAAPAGLGSGTGGGYVNAVPRRELASAAAAKQNPTPPTTTVEVAGAAPLAATETADQGQTQYQLRQSEPELSQDSVDRVAKAKAAAEQASPGMVPAPLLRTDPMLMGMAALRWTISASGALQRSRDGGKTWLDVNVLADNSMGSNLVPVPSTTVTEAQAEQTTQAGTEVKKNPNFAARPAAQSSAPASAKSAEAKSAEAKSAEAKSAEAERTPHTIFRAVAVSSNAAEVWAGGSGGALYHTLDGGNRWARVVPSEAGVRLTGDIIGIRFSDPHNGTVTTSDVEIWTTTDAGQTWHKQ